MQWSPVTVSIALLAGFYALLILKTKISNYLFARKHGCKSAGPYHDFLGFRRTYGIVTSLRNKQFPLYGQRLLERHGRNTIPVMDIGNSGYFTVDPRNIQAVLATNFKDWGMGSSRDFLHDFLGRGIFTQDGTEWHHSRAMLRPSFTRAQIADFEILEGHADELFYTIDVLKTTDNIVDVKDLVSDLTLDFSAQFLFGKSADALKQRREGGGEKGLAFWFGRCLWHVTTSFGFGTLHWLYRPKEYREGRKFVHQYIDGVVVDALAAHQDLLRTRAKAEKPGKYVFLSALTEEIQDPIVLRAQVINIMLAGRDTTASLISWCIWVLARNPAVFQKLRSEIRVNLGVGSQARLATWQELKDMKYLQAVIHETLRLYPSTPYSNRTAVRDTVLPSGGGPDENSPIFVPAGGTIAYTIFGLHRRKDIWGADAWDFIPERWTAADAGKKLRQIGWGHMPFSGGPRICPGQQFALTEASYMLVRFLQKYENIEKAPGVSDVPTWEQSAVAPPGDGVWVKLTAARD